MTSDIITKVYNKKMYKIIKLIDTNELQKLSLYYNNKLPYHSQSMINGISIRYRFDPSKFFTFMNYCVRKCNQYNYDLLALLLQIKNYDDMYGGNDDLKDIDNALIQGYNEYKGNIGELTSKVVTPQPQITSQATILHPQPQITSQTTILHPHQQQATVSLANNINMNDLIEITKQQLDHFEKELKTIDYHRIGNRYYVNRKFFENYIKLFENS